MPSLKWEISCGKGVKKRRGKRRGFPGSWVVCVVFLKEKMEFDVVTKKNSMPGRGRSWKRL